MAGPTNKDPIWEEGASSFLCFWAKEASGVPLQDFGGLGCAPCQPEMLTALN